MLRRPWPPRSAHPVPTAGTAGFDTASERRAEAEVQTGLTNLLRDVVEGRDLSVEGVAFPWHRSFEIDFAITGDVR